jgi:hypothetical protein
MLLTFAACGSIGLLLGFWFRVPALVAASSVTVLLYSSVGPFIELGPASAAMITFALVGVLQVGYLAGLMLSCAWSRVGAPALSAILRLAPLGGQHRAIS